MTQLVEYSPVLSWAIDITAALILLGVLCAFVRLVKGPTLPDRVVSVGVISVLAVAIAGLVAIAIAEVTALDVAFAGALVSFLATVAAHAIGRAAYRMRVPLWKKTHVDEWKGYAVPGRDDGIDQK